MQEMEIRIKHADGREEVRKALLEKSMITPPEEVREVIRSHWVEVTPEGRIVHRLWQRPEGQMDEMISYRGTQGGGIHRVGEVRAERIEIVEFAAA